MEKQMCPYTQKECDIKDCDGANCLSKQPTPQLATDGREELEKNVLIFVAKEFGEHKVRQGYSYSEACDLVFKYTAALQSQCTEKDQEIEKLYGKLEYAMKGYPEQEKSLMQTQVTLLSNLNTSQEKQIEELKAENERLKGQLAFQEDQLIKASHNQK